MKLINSNEHGFKLFYHYFRRFKIHWVNLTMRVSSAITVLNRCWNVGYSCAHKCDLCFPRLRSTNKTPFKLLRSLRWRKLKRLLSLFTRLLAGIEKIYYRYFQSVPIWNLLEENVTEYKWGLPILRKSSIIIEYLQRRSRPKQYYYHRLD